MKEQVTELSRNVKKTEMSWLHHCRGEALPYRGDIADIDPDYQFVLELSEDGTVRMRQVGLYVEALFGASLAGRDFITLFAEPHQKQCHQRLDDIFNGPSKIYLNAVSEAGDVQFGFFPLSSDYGPVNYAFGAVSLEDLPETHTLLLGVQSIESIALYEEVQEQKYGFAEDRASFAGPKKSAGFRVIEGGGAFAPPTRPGLRVINNVKREP